MTRIQVQQIILWAALMQKCQTHMIFLKKQLLDDGLKYSKSRCCCIYGRIETIILEDLNSILQSCLH